jgi:ketosteroid isomerase-like protein
MGRVALLDVVRSYYDALNTGDAEAVSRHFTEDATHYYTRLGPHQGAKTIGDHTHWAVENIDGQWHIENAIEDGEQAVIEWTMTWRDPESGDRRLDRGTEWFRFRDGRICEVRAYHHGNKRNPSGDLLGFDHAGRGYTTL